MPTLRPPADQAARDRAVHGRGENLWIEAGAGTGKTTLLVERILALLTDEAAPLRLSRLAAITFTEKAAGELKVKIRQEIEQRLHAGPDAPIRQRLVTALEELETAAIGTLHAFARQLLLELPVEAGVDPHGAVMDEKEFGEFLERTYDEWFDAQIRATPPAAALRWYLGEREFYERRGDWDWLWKIARHVCLNHDVLLDAPPPEAFSLAEAVADLRAAADAALAHAHANCTDAADKAFQETAAYAAAAEALPAAAQRDECLAAIAALPKFNLRVGAAGKWVLGEKDANKERRKTLREMEARLADVAQDPEVRALFELAREFARHFEQEKRRRGALGFQDLLVRAAEMLRGNKTARAYFQRRFDALLIDEFQDTDPLQVQIAFFLGEDGPIAARHDEVKLRPGSLVVVGDPKQSIYRFRRADIEIYEKTKRLLLGAAGPTFITANFRSAPAILQTVNAVFAPLMRYDAALPVSPSYVELHAGRDAWPEAAGAILLTPNRPFDSAAAARDAEYAAVARWIRHAHDTGLPVWDKDRQTTRAMQWRDVAILDRRTATFAGLEQALRDAAAPHRIEGGKVYFQREEIAAAVNGLLALENPDDSAALGQWLASELVGFSDDDLLAHVLDRPEARLTYAGDASADDIGRVLVAMRTLHENRNRDGCLATVRGLFDLVGALPTSFTFPRREVAAANLHKLLEAARAADQARQTFGEFARAWATMYREQREEADFAITEDADDVARVMTIHRAKGLDWPIVVVIDLAAEFKSPGGPPPVLLRRAENRLAVYLGQAAQTQGYAELKAQEDQFEKAERVRQLYVATTRARDYLVLPLFGRNQANANGELPQPKGYLEFLAEARLIDASLQVVDAMGARFEEIDVDALASAGAPRWELPREFDKRALSATARQSVADYAARRAAGSPPFPPAPAALEFRSPSAHDEPPPPAEHSAGPKMGEAFHALMERLDLADRATWDRSIAETATQYQLSPRESDLLHRWLGHFAKLPSFAQLAGARVWREIPFSWTDGAGVAYSGKLDLLAETAAGLLILDYKIDRFAPATMPAHMAYHRRQGEIYRDAVKALTGRDDVTTRFCFVEMGREETL